MCLSYGECSVIASEWGEWKSSHDNDGSADSALRFIEERCAEVYPDEEDQNEIFGYIGCLEEGE